MLIHKRCAVPLCFYGILVLRAKSRLSSSQLSLFNASNEWGIEVQSLGLGSYDALSEAVSSTLESDIHPDLLLAYGYQGNAWAGQADHFVDLIPYLQDPLWGMSSQDQADFIPAFWQAEAKQGIALPALRSAAVLYYNQTWARELGFDSPPGSPAEFQKQACAAAQALSKDSIHENDGQGGWIISTDPSAVMSWLATFGAEPAPAGASGYQFDTPQVIRAFTFLRGLYDQGCAWLPEDEPSEADFAARGGLFASGSSAAIAFQAEAFSAANSTDIWTVIPYPVADGEPVVTAYGPSLFITSSTPEKQLAAWLLARWLTTPEVQARWSQQSGYFPVRSSAVASLRANSAMHQQWAAALPLLGSAQAEPEQASWRTVRWAVSDAATQLFRYYFSADQAPSLAKFLQQTASEEQRRQSQQP